MSWQASIARMWLRHVYRRPPPPNISRADYVAGVRAAFDGQIRKLPSLPSRTELTLVEKEGVKGAWLIAPDVSPVRTLCYIHGGGYVWGSPKSHGDLALRLSRTMQARVFLLDYRLAPEHPFPAALEDGVAGWCWLIRQKGIDPATTVIAGDSAGGGLSLATLQALRDAGDPLPAAACLIAPWADLTGTAPSVDHNDQYEEILSAFGLRTIAPAYHGDTPADDPRVSPLFGDLTGLPPTLIQVGSREILLDDSVRLATAIREGGGDVRLDIWPKMPHVWHMLAFAVPESRKAIADMAAYARVHTKVNDG